MSRGKDSSSVSYVPQSEAEQTESYTDVPKTHWAYKSIQELTELGVVCGTGNGNFEPYRNVTRAEFVKMLMTALKTETTENVCTLTDVNTGDWYCGYVSTAQKIGMVTGDDNGRFNPNETISRQDMAVMVKRALDTKGIVLQKTKNVQFADADDIADYAKEAVAVLAGAGLLNGVDNGMFAPLSYADRAQAAKCISNMLQLAE